MRVALDTNPLYTTRAGVARYVRGLQQGFASLPPSLSLDLTLSPFAWPVENFEFRQPQRAWRTFYRECLWTRWTAPRALRRSKTDLLHSTGNALLIPPPGVRHVVTVHDIAVLRHPERFRPWHRRMSASALLRARAAHRVLCISRFTANELIHHCAFPAHQLEVVLNGSDFNETSPEIPPDPHLPTEFFLFVGSLEPGKNLDLLRRTYASAQASGHSLPPLLIVGARFPGLSPEGPAPSEWHFLGHLPDAQLVGLYRRAIALLFPSKYEGFGLPVAEAMNLGCPVICSPVSSLPEVGGDATLWTDLSPEAYVTSARQLIQDSSLRDDLILRGRRQGAHFTWPRCAEETLAIYRQALAT